MKNRIGIVGGGQLGRMLGFAAKRMGFTVTVIDPTPDSPAGQVVDRQIVARYEDEQAIRELAKESDYLTFEIELANDAILDEVASYGVMVNPTPKTLTIIKDKLLQKQFLKAAHLATAEFRSVESETEIQRAGETFGYPFLLKARFDAYDGRGNVLIKKPSDIRKGMEKLRGRKLYVEKFVPFVKELAVMVARSTKGEVKTYPVVETQHKNNICHVVLAPAPIAVPIRRKAERLATHVVSALHGAGVFGIELFLTKEGKVFVNEIAPRVHNSGHYTIEACVTDQFEQHIRAICGLPLGSTQMTVPAATMVNILGNRLALADPAGLSQALRFPNTSVHVYGKKETKPERKMGHITVIGKSLAVTKAQAIRARKFITI